MPPNELHHLPVTIRVVASESDLRKVLALRAAVAREQGRNEAEAAAPEARDRRADTTLLIAESRLDGEALGSLRILRGGRGRLAAEEHFELPAGLRSTSVAEASRQVLRGGRNAALVRLMLWKAFHRFCLASQIDTMLIRVRRPLDREYEWLGFRDALASDAPAGEYRLMTLGVFEAHEQSLRNRHPLYDFFFVERHPEIDLLAEVGTHAAKRRLAGSADLPDHARIAAQLQEVAIV